MHTYSVYNQGGPIIYSVSTYAYARVLRPNALDGWTVRSLISVGKGKVGIGDRETVSTAPHSIST